MRQRQQKKEQIRTQRLNPFTDKKPFIEHLHELRSRLLRIVIAVSVFSMAAYFVQQSIVHILLTPAANQHFIYTSPTGGIGFLFQLCTDVGIIAALPIIFYELLSFLKPLIPSKVTGFIIKCAIASGIMAILGIGFGYFIGLPLALHFLSHQFITQQIQALLTITEYMSFVSLYMFGAALLFQTPIVLIIINKIKPLSPRSLLKFERYLIAGAFIISMVMAPTINIADQLVIAGPIIIAYQISLVIVWLSNRTTKRQRYINGLLEKDRMLQSERLSKEATKISLYDMS